ncbi:MAG: hypothetical protein KDA28_08815, partial [Phycisphaerales bacterium]|nr:hypothetical protein [Phycisphaerales bacterium]
TMNFNFVFGNTFTVLAAGLLDPANFGPAGLGGDTIVFLPQVVEITPNDLVGVDMVLLSNSAEALSACEQIMLAEFVRQGGALFTFSNQAAIEMGPRFGATPSFGGGGNIVTWQNHPITSGPFGTAFGNESFFFHRFFEDVGPGTPFATEAKGAVGAAFEHGDGRAVIFCDEEWLLDFDLVGCGISSRDIEDIAVFYNAVSWIMPAGPVDFVPPNPCAVDLNQDWVRDIFDVLAFLDAFSSGSAIADWNADTIIDIFDVLAFLGEFDAGCWFE